MNYIIILLMGVTFGGVVSFYMIFNFYKIKLLEQEINYDKEKNKLLEDNLELIKKLNEVIKLCNESEKIAR